LVLEIRDVTDAADARRRWAETVAELREVNDRLLRAALREQELREKAQAASDAKSSFLATMSHELRTPLTAIIGYEELLADEITGPVTDAQRVQLRSIKRSAEHLLALIDELLTLAQIEAGRQEIRRQPVHVETWLDEASVLISPLAAAKRLAFTVVRLERPITIDSDPLKVRQILVNLLGNAVKFCERGEITLTARERGDSVFFEVRDTGIGISTEQLAHVFDPFWQADPRPTRKNQGIGLGLAISRHLAQRLGGDLTVESAFGRGSTFTFRLPFDPSGAGRG
jgi:signal transduction histidine kinase